MKTTTFIKRALATGLAVVGLANARAVNAAVTSYELQGQSRDTAVWTTNVLNGWRELDTIPCRVQINDGPIENQTIIIFFPHSAGGVAAFEDIYDFSTSSNAVFTTPPSLFMDPSGLWSYSVKVTVSNSEPAFVNFGARLAYGSHRNPNNFLVVSGSPSTMGMLNVVTPSNRPPTVTLTIPTNGAVYLAPASVPLVADAQDVDGTVTNVLFLQNGSAVASVAGGNPFAAGVNGLGVGAYTFTAVAFDDEGLMTTSAPVNISVIEQLPLAVISSLKFNPQTGLYQQGVRVTNPSVVPAAGVRIYISGLDGAVKVYNATGTTNGLPFVQSLTSIGAGGSIDMVIEYYITRSGAPAPALNAVIIPSNPGGSAVALGTDVAINRSLTKPDGVMIEFRTQVGRVYLIQYSGDMTNWKQASTPVDGTGTWVQWIDNGQPKTESAPSSVAARYYRIVSVP